MPTDWIDSHAWLNWEAPRNYVAGEASYAKALARLTGPPCTDGYCVPVVVQLVREPRNAYDANAVRAEVSNVLVGYLRRHLAAQLAPVLDRAHVTRFAVAGLLRGGSTRAPSIGCHVWLDRVLSPDGLVLTLPDDEWVVSWPVHEWELPQSSGSRP